MSISILPSQHAFIENTDISFIQYLRENPNSRRVSQDEVVDILSWLRNDARKPTSQKEFNRRNYVRKTFSLDPKTQTLVTRASSRKKSRIVVPDDMILRTVKLVHVKSNHAGWDATWKRISDDYYGILRSDMIYLLKRCEHCSRHPNRRPKYKSASLADGPGSLEPDGYDLGVRGYHDLDAAQTTPPELSSDPLRDFLDFRGAAPSASGPDRIGLCGGTDSGNHSLSDILL